MASAKELESVFIQVFLCSPPLGGHIMHYMLTVHHVPTVNLKMENHTTFTLREEANHVRSN